MRIVSLIASSTEIICALGLRDQMVGRSHECDYPESVLELPVCTAPKFKTSGSSGAIDARVKEILQESLSVYRVDADMLNRLNPTHIITQTQCEVCAVSLKDVEAALKQMLDVAPAIVSLQPNSIADIIADIKRVAAACDANEAAEKLLKRLNEEINSIKSQTDKIELRPRVALIEWIDPIMPGANWMPELVNLAGGKNLFGTEGQHSEVMPWIEVAEADPDVIIVAPCGFTIAQTLVEMPSMEDKRGWHDLNCVKNNRVFIADGNHYFNRPGPRVLESLQIMCEILHPELFQFGFEGTGWVRYTAK